MLKGAWSAIKSPTGAAVMGIAGLLAGAYFSIYYERQGDLVVRINSLSKVIDVHQPVGGLQVTYAGENLRTSNRTLWILTATVENRGNAAVRKGDFDDDVPLGFRIAGAVPVEQPQLRSSTQYLQAQVKASARADLIAITPAVFEPGDSVQLAVLLLGPESSKPTVVASGKVAGQRTIEVVDAEDTDRAKDAFDRFLPGQTRVAITVRGALRISFWLMVVVLGVVVIAILVASVVAGVEALGRRLRLRRSERLFRGLGDAPIQQEIKDAYVRGGVASLAVIAEGVQAAQELQNEYLPHLGSFKDESEKNAFIERFAPEDYVFLTGSLSERMRIALSNADGIGQVKAALDAAAAVLSISIEPSDYRGKWSRVVMKSSTASAD